MKTLITRSASGIVFVALMLGGILWNQYSFALLMSLILAGAINEYYNITAAKREPGKARTRIKWLVLILSLLVYWRSFLLSSPPVTSTTEVNSVLCAFVLQVFRLRDANLPMNALIPIFAFVLFAYELFTESENSFNNIGWNLIAIFWILVPILLTNNLYFEKGGAFLVAVFVLIWVYDSASYVSGSLFGKHPLFKRISPKKTIEGSVGGVLLTLIFAYFINQCPRLTMLSKLEWMVLAFVIIVSATFGDLVESMLKRNLGIKDSGSIMPGHGGFLDRFDAYLFTVPFIIATLWIISQLQNMMLVFDYLNK